MAISGAWKENTYGGQSGALKWGTGINPIHGVRTDVRGRRTIQGDAGPPPKEIEDVLLEHDLESVDYADSSTWGYNDADGTALRPDYQQLPEEYRGTSKLPARDQPGMRFRSGGMRNAGLRAQSKVSEREETVSEGWENKDTGRVDDARTSDVSQYEMQTSMAQRDKERHGSQISGTASEHSAPIPSRRPTWGQRMKPWSGGRRHYDMTPHIAEERIRPFLYRNAGTGDTSWMPDNEATHYMVTPLDRQPIQSPYSGEQTPRASSPEYEPGYDWSGSWY